MIITTTQQIEGYEIVAYLGLVGKQTSLSTADINKELEELARKLGANAIVGLVIYPITEVSGSRFYTSSDIYWCYAYGTAVRIKEILSQPPLDNLPKLDAKQPDLKEKSASPKVMERWDMKINQWDMQE